MVVTIRREQVESVLRRAISRVLSHGLSDPRIAGLVSVTHVDVTDDLSLAKVYVSVLPQQYEKRTIAGLRHAARHVQRRLQDQVELRRPPQLDFRLDESIKLESQVLADINTGMARTPAVPPADDDHAEAAGGPADVVGGDGA